MKKVVTTNVRKVYTSSTALQQQQLNQNAVRKINNLLSSGTVSVSSGGSSTPRILKTTVTRSSPQQQNVIITNNNQQMKCYVCDEAVGVQGALLMDTATNVTQTKLPNKIGRVIGDAFLVIVRADDMVCRRCVTIFNQIDRFETDLERLKANVMNYVCKKYAITNDDADTAVVTTSTQSSPIKQPVAKMQKLNSGQSYAAASSEGADLNSSGDGIPATTIRKVVVAGHHNNEVPALVRSSTGSTISSASATTPSPHTGGRKVQMKIYKCMSCDFTTSDLKQFQPHYAVCPSTASEHAAANSVNNSSVSSSNSNSVTKIGTGVVGGGTTVTRKIVSTAKVGASSGTFFSCNMCPHKSLDKASHEEHMRKHIKVKPFKCRICSMRFETRETASKHAKTHQTEYFKCGACSVSFPQREQLLKHFEVHQKDQNQPQSHVVIKTTTTSNAVAHQQQQVASGQGVSTQKLLQETIDEALRGTGEEIDAKGIHFFSCNICSLTFIQENYYTQHMETHKREPVKKTVTGSSAPTSSSSSSSITTSTKVTSAKQENQKSAQQQIVQSSSQLVTKNNANGQSNVKSEINDDLESIFEKMHSDKTEGTGKNDLSFNMQDGGGSDGNLMQASSGIDMPVLDQGEEQQATPSGPPVSMPSLDDDGEQENQQGGAAANVGGEGGVPMEIEDMNNSVEGGEQIKFILNENGQLLQLDNHIITTDADGNQIIVQGADSDQTATTLQQLLQSVAGMEGGTIQMIGGENNQMILVQQGDEEPQLINASLLNADGQILIQQAHADGEMSVDGTASQSSEDVQAQAQYEADQQQQQQQQQEEHQQQEEQQHQEEHQQEQEVEHQEEQQQHEESGQQVPVGSGEEESSMDESANQQQQPQVEVQHEEGDENSQTTSEAAPVTADQNESGGVKAEESVDEDSQAESSDQKVTSEEAKNGEVKEDSSKADETAVSTTTTEEKITSSAQPATTEENDYYF